MIEITLNGSNPKGHLMLWSVFFYYMYVSSVYVCAKKKIKYQQQQQQKTSVLNSLFQLFKCIQPQIWTYVYVYIVYGNRKFINHNSNAALGVNQLILLVQHLHLKWLLFKNFSIIFFSSSQKQQRWQEFQVKLLGCSHGNGVQWNRREKKL